MLVVVDDDDVRRIAELSLELIAGWRVSTAASGWQCCAKAARHRPDAILLDVMMPGMDAVATCGHLRDDARTRTIPVILFTADIQADQRHDFAGLDLAGIITKPFDPVTMATNIERLLGWPPTR